MSAGRGGSRCFKGHYKKNFSYEAKSKTQDTELEGLCKFLTSAMGSASSQNDPKCTLTGRLKYFTTTESW